MELQILRLERMVHLILILILDLRLVVMVKLKINDQSSYWRISKAKRIVIRKIIARRFHKAI